jgi:hypothetical protein
MALLLRAVTVNYTTHSAQMSMKVGAMVRDWCMEQVRCESGCDPYNALA